MSGILLSLLVIAAGATFFFVLSRRAHGVARRVAAAGFETVAEPPAEITGLAASLFDLRVETAYRRAGPESAEWLVELAAPGTEDTAPAVLILPLGSVHFPELAAFRTSAKIPRWLRRLTGGAYGRLAPLEDRTPESLAASGWVAFADPAARFDAAVMERFAAAVRIPEEGDLLGVALCGDHLAVWAEPHKEGKLLIAGARVRDRFREGVR